jgi:hypothetical protein
MYCKLLHVLYSVLYVQYFVCGVGMYCMYAHTWHAATYYGIKLRDVGFQHRLV